MTNKIAFWFALKLLGWAGRRRGVTIFVVAHEPGGALMHQLSIRVGLEDALHFRALVQAALNVMDEEIADATKVQPMHPQGSW